jgi:molybdate transport system substrate-binding protein
MRTRNLAVVLLAGFVATGVAACGSDNNASDSGTQPTTTLTVLGASSLTDAFPAIGDAFTQQHPDIEFQWSFAGSSELVAQVDAGSPADVLALAGTSSLDALKAKTSEPVTFAHNKLTIIVPTGNPGDVHGIEDLANPDVKVALAGPDVPAGYYAAEAFKNAGIKVDPVSEEVDVKSVVTRVSLGGADAGVVYVTDAMAAQSGIEEVPIPDKVNVIATYPAVVINDSEHADAAKEFVDFLTSDKAQQILSDYGFISP